MRKLILAMMLLLPFTLKAQYPKTLTVQKIAAGGLVRGTAPGEVDTLAATYGVGANGYLLQYDSAKKKYTHLNPATISPVGLADSLAKKANRTFDNVASGAIAQAKVSGLVSDLALKAPLANPTFTGTVVLPSTTSIGTVSNTEIGYLDNVTSSIQTQLNAKEASLTFSTGLTRSTNTITINQAFTPTWTGLHTFSAGLSSNGGGDFRATSGIPVGSGLTIAADYSVLSNPRTRFTAYGQSTAVGGFEFRHLNGSGSGLITSATSNQFGTWNFSKAVTLNSTLSPWGPSTFIPLQIGTGNDFIVGRNDGASSIQIGTNAYYDDVDWRYATTGVAARYYQASGGHVWSGAVSGTVGNVATWSTLMTLGNTGVFAVNNLAGTGTRMVVVNNIGEFSTQAIPGGGGGGTVASVSVNSANGLSGTSSGGANPALTLSTTVTGLLKGNGTAISAATAMTDYLTGSAGTLAPTLTGITNISSSTANLSTYSRVGNIVTQFGSIDVTPTAAGSTSSIIDISLGVPSNFVSITDLNGHGQAPNTLVNSVMITANTTNDRARLEFTSTTTANVRIFYSFQYIVL